MIVSTDGFHRELVSELDGWGMGLILYFLYKYKFCKETLEYSYIYSKIIVTNLYGL